MTDVESAFWFGVAVGALVMLVGACIVEIYLIW